MQYPQSDDYEHGFENDYEMPLNDEPSGEAVAEKGDAAQAQLEGEDRLRMFHLKAILVSGIGFFTDAYDLQVISSIKPMMAMARWPGTVHAEYQGDLRQHGVGSLPTLTDLEFSAIALIGTLTGQLFFGTLGDVVGRKGAYGLTLILMVGMTIMQACATWGDETSFTALFLTWRFLLGVGIGGDYPLSAIISSEYASTKLRGPMVAAVKSMQGIGTLFAACIGMAVAAGYTPSTTANCTPDVSCREMDACWRIIVGIGAIPAALTFYLRAKLPESPRFTSQVDNDLELAAANTQVAIAGSKVDKKNNRSTKNKGDRITLKSFGDFICRRKNLWILVGCSGAWFFQDIAYYSQSLFTPDILTNIGFNPKLTLASTGADMALKAYKTCAGNAIISLCGTVPGYFPVIFLINKMGRKGIQFMGFSVMTTTLMIMSAAYPQLLPNAKPPNAASVNGTPWAYLLLFCLMFFFANFGPNTTEFIIPGELFPTKFRSTCHGIASASGKVGAVVGSFGFGWMVIGAKNGLSTSYPLDSEVHAMQLSVGLLSVMCFMGLLCTFLVPETTGLSLEEVVAKYHDFEDTAAIQGKEEGKDSDVDPDEEAIFDEDPVVGPVPTPSNGEYVIY